MPFELSTRPVSIPLRKMFKISIFNNSCLFAIKKNFPSTTEHSLRFLLTVMSINRVYFHKKHVGRIYSNTIYSITMSKSYSSFSANSTQMAHCLSAIFSGKVSHQQTRLYFLFPNRDVNKYVIINQSIT